MEEEIEDLVGDVKYTDSQKSVATSNVYSLDFTDSSSDKHNSSGKDTYVIECDDSDDSEKTYHLHENPSVIDLKKSRQLKLNCEAINKISKSTSASFHIAQEIFTQTSKTIIELAETEEAIRKAIDNKTLETQTSFISISENRTVEYRIEVSGTHIESKSETCENNNDTCYNITCNQVLTSSLEDGSSKFILSESENERVNESKSDNSINSNNDKIIEIINDGESRDSSFNENKDESQYDNSSVFEKSDTDVDEGSLMCNEYNENKNYKGDNNSDTSEVPKSIDSEVEDLYKKLSEKINVGMDRPCDQEIPRFNTLSPLTEETEKVTVKTESVVDITPDCSNIADLKDDDKYFVFTNNFGIKVKALPSENTKNERDNLKLPPIKNNQSCPTSPHLNFLFSGNSQRFVNKSYSLEGHKDWYLEDRWEIGTNLAAGESPLISDRSDPARKPDAFLLPPIHAEGNKQGINSSYNKKNDSHVSSDTSASVRKSEESSIRNDSINIKDKITELKMSGNNLKAWPQTRYHVSTTDSKTSRSVSPDDHRLGDVAERGCDSLCVDILRRLRSASWFEVAETLEEIPRVMEKFWGVISENRIADIIRLVSGHVESPRTQVARSACHTLAAILKNTNYTKKPDFYEAVTSLLVKTGSYSRPVRRAANVALDGIVCGVELTHAVTALCVHGASHKSPLVRCAAARLLVVCCALAGGGRELLRARPPSAACARRHALRALAALLEDKATETRKYAERLYSMLRPLNNFEAFYLTDVDVDVAARQMKRFDQLLVCGPKEAR